MLARAQRQADESRERAVAGRAERSNGCASRRQLTSSPSVSARCPTCARVADLALLAASRVVGETMTSQRERRLVEEFLTDVKN